MSRRVDERERLLVYVDKSRGHFSLAVACYADEGQARTTWEALAGGLRERGCSVALVDLSGAEEDVDLMGRLELVARDAEAIFVVGLEALLVEDDRPRRTRAVARLNFNRDLLRARVPIPVVLWLSRRANRALAILAPDTFDVARTSFELGDEPGKGAGGVACEDAPSPSPWRRRPSWMRPASAEARGRLEARRAMLRSLHDEADPIQAGDLAVSLADVGFALGQAGEGGRWLAVAAEEHERAGNLGAAVTAWRRRGELGLALEDVRAAKGALDRAWALVERIAGSSDPVETAGLRPDVMAVRGAIDEADRRMRTRGAFETDLALLERWRAGDSDAGSELLARYFNFLRVFLLGRVPEAQVEDLIQEVYTRLVEALPRFEGRTSLKTFLAGIARSVASESLRARYRRAAAAEPFDSGEFVIVGDSPEERLASRESYRNLMDALVSLPLEMFDLLDLRYFQELGLQEIAEILGVPLGTAKSRLRRARRRLADAYAERSGALSEHDLEAELRDYGRRRRYAVG